MYPTEMYPTEMYPTGMYPTEMPPTEMPPAEPPPRSQPRARPDLPPDGHPLPDQPCPPGAGSRMSERRRGPDLPALDYPWTPVERAGVLTETGFRPTILDGARSDDRLGDLLNEGLHAARAAGLARRTPVLGVGSNRSDVVMAAKFAELGVSCVLALTSVRVGNLGVGHSAHVSRRGYLAAAPIRDPGGWVDLTMGWLDEAQLEALDRTEPNYERVELSTCDHPLTGFGADRPGFWVYRSRWGLLAASAGRYLPLASQPEVQRLMSELPGLTDLWPRGDPRTVIETLADPALRDRVREALRAAGSVLPSGLGPAH